MQTYRLTVDADGCITIPNTLPGQIVTVHVESEPLTLATAKTPEERSEVITHIMENARQLQDLMKDAPPFTTDDLYGEDGLPK